MAYGSLKYWSMKNTRLRKETVLTLVLTVWIFDFRTYIGLVLLN